MATQAWVGFGEVSMWAWFPRGHCHLLLVALGSLAAAHQQMAMEHLWSSLTCLKMAHSHRPDGLVWFLTVPKTELTNIKT